MQKLRIASLLLVLLGGFSTVVSAAESTASPPAVQAQAASAVVRVDLNSADAETLARELSGVGEAKARAIVEYREANGAFTSVDELLEVKGIGTAILDRNRERLVAN